MDISAFIESGILEGYILDAISKEDKRLVEEIIAKYPEVKSELALIEESLSVYTNEHQLTPPSQLKTKILADIQNYNNPPILNPESKIEDYSLWLNNTEPPTDYADMHMEVIGDYEEAKMVIAWVKNGEIDHTHQDYDENFLIVEGSCRATINGITKDYYPGDYVSFPIHKVHSYEVTSPKPMKVIACLDFRAA